MSLNADQKQLLAEFLEWLKDPNGARMRRIDGYAGTGKTYAIKEILIEAACEGLIGSVVDDVVFCAPTHQAKRVLRRSVGDKFTVKTNHAALGLRPQIPDWDLTDEMLLQQLKEENESNPSGSDDPTHKYNEILINQLLAKQDNHFKRKQDFVPIDPLFESTQKMQLIVADEWSMIDKSMFGYFVQELSSADSCQRIVFMGDPAQLPPIKEEMSQVYHQVKPFTTLSKVERYSGAILAYCETVRNKKTPLSDLHTLHLRIAEKYPDDDSLLILSQRDVLADAKSVFEDEGRVRIFTPTNRRVRELNYTIRSILKQSSAIGYEPGDELITMGTISHDYSGDQFLIECGSKTKTSETQCQRSVPIILENIAEGHDTIRCTKGTFERAESARNSIQGPSGKVYHRNPWFYHIEDAEENEQVPYGSVLMLLDPSEVYDWETELTEALSRAQSASSRSHTQRGQKGDAAKAAWEYLGIKNWNKRKDDSSISYDQFKKIRSKLWVEYYRLLAFVDPVSFPYASTVHKGQGDTFPVVIADLGPLLKMRNSATWDLRRILYTLATRASKQLVIMI